MSSEGMEGNFVSQHGAASVSPVPLLHSPRLDSATPAQLRKQLHDLSNTLTGLLGNLELAGMAAEDGELDSESVTLALDGARAALHAIRGLKQSFDQCFPER